jgi:MFS family permease
MAALDAPISVEQSTNSIQGLQSNAVSKERKPKRARNVSILLGVILVSYLVVGFPDGAFTVSWLGISDEIYGMTTAHTGWILVAYSVTYTLAGIALAKLAARWELPKLYLAGLIVMALGFLALAFAPNFGFVTASIALYGLGTGLMASSMNSYMAKHFTTGDNNWMHFFWGIGAAISPLIMGFTMDQGTMFNKNGWRAGYIIIIGIIAVVSVVLAITLYRKMWLKDDAESSTVNTATGSIALTAKCFLTKKWHEWLQISIFFFLGGTDYTLVFFVGAALIQRGTPAEQVVIFSTVYYVFMALARMVVGWVARWLGEVAIIRLAVAVSALGIAIIFFSSHVVGMAIVGFGLGPLLPTLVSDTSNFFKPSILPRIVGLELAAFGAGIAVLFFVTSQVMHFVTYEALFPIAAFFVVAVFVLNEVLVRTHRKLAKAQVA